MLGYAVTARCGVADRTACARSAERGPARVGQGNGEAFIRLVSGISSHIDCYGCAGLAGCKRHRPGRQHAASEVGATGGVRSAAKYRPSHRGNACGAPGTCHREGKRRAATVAFAQGRIRGGNRERRGCHGWRRGRQGQRVSACSGIGNTSSYEVVVTGTGWCETHQSIKTDAVVVGISVCNSRAIRITDRIDYRISQGATTAVHPPQVELI